MKNTINYYYNLNPDKISKIFHYYYFYIDNDLYYFLEYDRKYEDRFAIYEFNQQMIRENVLVNEIIDNKNHNVVTIVNRTGYILVKVVINIHKPISLSEIHYLSSFRIHYDDKLMRSNWGYLWMNKIDYLEYFTHQNYKKYPIIVESFNYFVGMAENAISYIQETSRNVRMEQSDIGVISHDVMNTTDTVYALYNPMNIIIDHKSRDVAEYIKLSFFQDNFHIFEELDEYFKYNYYSFYGISLLIARVLYPSFYFDMYDDIVNNKIQESEILKITSRTREYENYLRDVFLYFKKYYNIKEIDWITKKTRN